MSTTTTTREAQIMEALQRAHVVRMSQANLRGRIKRGEVDVRELIMDPQPPVSNWHALDLAQRCPGIGAVRQIGFGRDAMRVGVNLAMPFGRMSTEHRRWVADWLSWAVRDGGSPMRTPDIEPPRTWVAPAFQDLHHARMIRIEAAAAALYEQQRSSLHPGWREAPTHMKLRYRKLASAALDAAQHAV